MHSGVLCCIAKELHKHFLWISRSLLHKIAVRFLFLKLCARWVQKNPHTWTQKLTHGSTLTFLQWYYNEGNDFLGRIITGDETYTVHLWNQAAVDALPSQWISVQDHIQADCVGVGTYVQCFLGLEGHSAHLFPTQVWYVDTNHYCETLQNLWWAIHNKRRGMFNAGVVLLHDYNCPHTVQCSVQNIYCRNFAGMCLTILPATSNFSCTWRSSCSISIFPVIKTCRWLWHAVSNPMCGASIIQYCKNWFHDMTSVTILVVYMLRSS